MKHRRRVPVRVEIPPYARVQKIEHNTDSIRVSVTANCRWRLQTARGDVYGQGTETVQVPTAEGLTLWIEEA